MEARRERLIKMTMQPLSNSPVHPATPIQPIGGKPHEPQTFTTADLAMIERLEVLELSGRTVDHNAFLETPLPTLYALEEKQMDDSLRRRVQHLIEMRLFCKPREEFAALFEEPKKGGYPEPTIDMTA